MKPILAVLTFLLWGLAPPVSADSLQDKIDQLWNGADTIEVQSTSDGCDALADQFDKEYAHPFVSFNRESVESLLEQVADCEEEEPTDSSGN